MKILVRLPDNLSKMMMGLPFLFAINEKYLGSEIYVLTNPKHLEIIKLLPLKLEIYGFDKNKNRWPWNMHHFAYNLKFVFNIDIYFDLAEDFPGAYLGYAFKAKKRVGYKAEKLKDRIFTNVYQKKDSVHKTHEYVNLLSSYLEEEIKIHKVVSNLPKRFYDEEFDQRYIVVNLNADTPEKIVPIKRWKDLMESFVGLRFVFIGDSSEGEKLDEMLNFFTPKNNYENFAGKIDQNQIVSLLAYARGFITVDTSLPHLSTFLDTPTALFCDSSLNLPELPIYAKGECLFLEKTSEQIEKVHLEDFAEGIKRVFNL